MLTAKSSLEDRIEGLNAGADYYLTKPFDARELLACVGALLRRQGAEVNALSFGNTTLDLASGTLICGQRQLRLSAREFDVMRYLCRQRGRMCPRRPFCPRSGALIPTRWRTMWRSTSASCAKACGHRLERAH